MSLSRDARARFARQISLPEIGEQGQLRLAETRVRCGNPVAALYLERAGLDVVDAPNEAPALHVQAGDPALHEAAAFLSGALAAVEAIKTALGAGTPLQLPQSLQLKEPSS
jgi:hypothetical protein